jgi:hypothetical protein
MLRASEYKIRFKKKDFVALQGTVNIITLLSTIIFYVFFTNTLFLFYIKNIDNISIELYNLKNILV